MSTSPACFDQGTLHRRPFGSGGFGLLVGCLVLLGSCGVPNDGGDGRPVPGEPDKDQPGTDSPKDPLPGKECIAGQLHFDGVCQDAGTWQRDAAGLCQARGLGLGSLSLQEACGKGGFGDVRFTCCPGKVPEPACFTGKLGGDRCRDAAAWREEVAKLCESKAAQVSQFSLVEPCADGSFRFVQYQCCPGKLPPPPPPPMCFNGKLDDVNICRDADALKLEASKLCESKGARLANIVFGRACEGGGYTSGEYQCCPAK